MNRDELLLTVLGLDPSVYVPGVMVESSDGPNVVAHADIYWRRVIVHPVTASAGEAAQAAGDTLTVAAVKNACVDPAYRGQGWGRALIEGIRDTVSRHERIDFIAVRAEDSQARSFFELFGYGPHGDLLVCPLRPAEAPWPEGRIEVYRW